MHMRVAIVYDEPSPSRYNALGEEKAVLGVLEAVEAVHRALLELGFEVTRVPLGLPLERAESELKNPDVLGDLVFNLFEGFCGYPETEARVPEILSEMGVPFTGCSGPVLRLALNKAETKLILKSAGLRTPDFQLLDPGTLNTFRLDYPCIVKPCCEDASHGLSAKSVVYDSASLKRQVELLSKGYRGDALVEVFIDGREFSATILGDSEYRVLPVSEIVYSLPPEMPRVLTYAAKWEPDSFYFEGTKVVCPAEIGTEERQRIAETAVAAFRVLGGQGYARVDLRLDREEHPNVIEVNPNPDISPGTGATRQSEAAGMTYAQFIEKIIQLALQRKVHEDH